MTLSSLGTCRAFGERLGGPEGLQQPQDSSGKTRNLTPEVAKCAAISDYLPTEPTETTARKAVRAGAIDTWIADGPVPLPDVFTLGIRAMVLAAASGSA